MRVEELMSTAVHTCGPDETLEMAAQRMWDGDCGCLPVCTADGALRPVGMITDRDIAMCALFQRKPLQELQVSQAMARELQVCRPQELLADVESRMQEAQIRRLPVVNEQGELIGIVALSDLARAAARQRGIPETEITDREVEDTMLAIWEPRRPRATA